MIKTEKDLAVKISDKVPAPALANTKYAFS